MDETCTLNPKAHIFHFIILILWPTVAARLIIYLATRNVNYVTMTNCMFFLNTFWNAAYGLWTVYNIVAITQVPHDCRCSKVNNQSLLELNYEVLIIFGVFPALITLFFFAAGVLCCPYISYVLYMNRREELVQNHAT